MDIKILTWSLYSSVMCLGILYPTQSWLMPYVPKILSSTKASPSHYHPVSYDCIFLHFFLLPKPIHAHQQHDVRSQSIYPVKNISIMGCSRKDPHFPHRGNFCRPEGEGRKKCIRTSKGGRGINIQFPPWGRYGCFLEWPNVHLFTKQLIKQKRKSWSVYSIY